MKDFGTVVKTEYSAHITPRREHNTTRRCSSAWGLGLQQSEAQTQSENDVNNRVKAACAKWRERSGVI